MTDNHTEDILGHLGPLSVIIIRRMYNIWALRDAQKELRQKKNTRCGLGRAEDKSEGIK